MSNKLNYMLLTTLATAEGGTEAIFEPLVLIKSLFLGIIGIIGIILLAKSIYELSIAIQDSDNAGISRALKGIVGGILCAGIGTVLAFLKIG